MHTHTLIAYQYHNITISYIGRIKLIVVILCSFIIPMIRDSILGTEQTQYVSIQQTLIHSFIMCMELHTNSIEVLFVQSMYDVSARTERVLCVPPNHYPWHIRILHSENDLLWPKNHVFVCENVLSSNVAQSRTTNFI